MSLRLRRTGLFLAGAVVAGALAAFLVKDQVRRQRRNLFSANAFRRMGALRHMTGEPASVDAINLLRDFAAWEPRRMLRANAQAIVERMEREVRQRTGNA